MKTFATSLFDSMPVMDCVPPHIAARDKALEQLEKRNGEVFRARARAFALDFLRVHGPKSGEDITDACKAAGIIPHTDKAFGCIYGALSRQGLIERAGFCERKKGNGTCGGIVWKLKL